MNDSQRRERRRKRMITPLVYCLVELTFFWLVLSLIQVEFSFFSWEYWAIGIFILCLMYSIAKTVHVYNRQKDYPEEKEI